MFNGLILINDTFTECKCEGPLCNGKEGIKCYSNPKRHVDTYFNIENLEKNIVPENLITCQPPENFILKTLFSLQHFQNSNGWVY